MPNAEISPIRVEVRKYKSCRGNEGDAYSLELWIDGSKAADVTQAGTGGSADWYWHDKSLEKKWDDFVKNLAPAAFHDQFIDYDCDMALEDLVNDMLEEKKLRRLCKKHLVIKKPDSPPGEYLEISVPYDPTRRASILATYPGAEIVNERFTPARGGPR